MATDIQALEERYIDSCTRHGVLPNSAILSSFFKAELRKFHHELCNLEILLDHLEDVDVPPLLDMFAELDASVVEAVDVRNESSCILNGELTLSLMRSVKQRLRLVDLQDYVFGKEFLRNLSQKGLSCKVLNLRSSHFRKLSMTGEFIQTHTLNLDFSTSLNSFREGCFACMPKLRRLSMCDTRIANLWTTVAALSKLPSLVELRFQNLRCCNGAASSTSSSVRSEEDTAFCQLNSTYYEETYIGELTDHASSIEEMLGNLFSANNTVLTHEAQSMSEESSDDSDVDFSNHQHEYGFGDLLSNGQTEVDGIEDPEDEDSFGPISWSPNGEGSSAGASTSGWSPDGLLKYTSHNAAPICYEKHYRDYLIASLPRLEILDDLPIRRTDRQKATVAFSENFEYLPYRRKLKENVVSILQKRELKSSHAYARTSNSRPLYSSGKSRYSYRRSLCAAKVGSSAWPYLHPISISGGSIRGADRSFRPRQFEYHPSDPSLMVFGTLDGEVVVINHESEKIVRYIPSFGEMNSVLGLCWLKRYPSKVVAGSDNGSLKLYDIQHMPSAVSSTYSSAGSITYGPFDQLTSVHVNSTDELFLASGYSRDVALYDINSGRRLQMFSDMHRAHINVVKFAHHSPSIFVTSSFDQDIKMWDLRQKPLRPCYTVSSSRGNVMVCFSPDDHYLLASAVDNEVTQFLAVDGRLHLKFDITPTGSSQNYTRSYYMNGRDYIISGSCDEHVVRVCCAQTGRRLRDVSLEGRGSGSSMFVQSLRGDPFREFNMSILAAYMRPCSKSEIVKVNLLASSEYPKESSYSQLCGASNSWGG